MKYLKFKFLAFIFLFTVAVFTPSCEALLQALEETNTTQVDDEKNTDANQNSKGKTQGDSNSSNDGTTSTSKGKK